MKSQFVELQETGLKDNENHSDTLTEDQDNQKDVQKL